MILQCQKPLHNKYLFCSLLGYVFGKLRVLKRRVLQRLRKVGLCEGTSTLLLFFVAMPLKYMAGKPLAVSIVGAIHGCLFLLYCAVLWHATSVQERPLKWAAKFFVAALVPFGPFVVDGTLKRELDELNDPNDPPSGD